MSHGFGPAPKQAAGDSFAPGFKGFTSMGVTKGCMTIALNGREITTAADTVASLLAEQGYGCAKVATALNEEFVPERARGDRTLKAGDRVEIVSVRQGG